MQNYTSSICFVRIIRVFNKYNTLAEQLYTHNKCNMYYICIWIHFTYAVIYISHIISYIYIHIHTYHISENCIPYQHIHITSSYTRLVWHIYIYIYISYLHISYSIHIEYVTSASLLSSRAGHREFLGRKVGFDSSSRTLCSYSIDAVAPRWTCCGSYPKTLGLHQRNWGA